MNETIAHVMTSLDAAERDVLKCLFIHGPTHDGYVPSKAARDTLFDKRLLTRGAGYNWLTDNGVRQCLDLKFDEAKRLHREAAKFVRYENTSPSAPQSASQWNRAMIEAANKGRDDLAEAQIQLDEAINKNFNTARKRVEAQIQDELDKACKLNEAREAANKGSDSERFVGKFEEAKTLGLTHILIPPTIAPNSVLGLTDDQMKKLREMFQKSPGGVLPPTQGQPVGTNPVYGAGTLPPVYVKSNDLRPRAWIDQCIAKGVWQGKVK
jgi:hypothetical protein